MVELEGNLLAHGKPIDKWVGRRRKIIATVNMEELLKKFARWCALQVIHLWNVPPVVRKYLQTGNDSLREEAETAAEAAYWAAEGDCVTARAVTEAAARAAYWAADEAAIVAAYWAAYCAAEADDNTAKYREKFEEMVKEAFEKENI
jgi:hypothetical protein